MKQMIACGMVLAVLLAAGCDSVTDADGSRSSTVNVEAIMASTAAIVAATETAVDVYIALEEAWHTPSLLEQMVTLVNVANDAIDIVERLRGVATKSVTDDVADWRARIEAVRVQIEP